MARILTAVTDFNCWWRGEASSGKRGTFLKAKTLEQEIVTKVEDIVKRQAVRILLAGTEDSLDFQGSRTDWKAPATLPSWRMAVYEELLFSPVEVEDGIDWTYCSGKIFSMESQNVELARRGGGSEGSLVFYANHVSALPRFKASRLTLTVVLDRKTYQMAFYYPDYRICPSLGEDFPRIEDADSVWPPPAGAHFLDELLFGPSCYEPHDGDVQLISESGFLRMLELEASPAKRILVWKKESLRERILYDCERFELKLSFCPLFRLARLAARTKCGKRNVLAYFRRGRRGCLKVQGLSDEEICLSFSSSEKFEDLVSRLSPEVSQKLDLVASALLALPLPGRVYWIDYSPESGLHADGMTWISKSAAAAGSARWNRFFYASSDFSSLRKCYTLLDDGTYLLNYYKVASFERVYFPILQQPVSSGSRRATSISVAVQTSPSRDSVESARVIRGATKRNLTPDHSYSSPSKKLPRSRSSSESGCSVVSEYSIKASSTIEVEMNKMFGRVSTLPPLIPSFSAITVTRNLDPESGPPGFIPAMKSPDGLEKLKSYVESVNAELMRQQQQEKNQELEFDGPSFTVQDEVVVACNDDDGEEEEEEEEEERSRKKKATGAFKIPKKN